MPSTHVSIATHKKWQIIAEDGSTKNWSWTKERDLLQQLRSTHGNDKLVIQNNGIGNSTSGWNGPPSQAPDLWAFMRNDPGRNGFQGGVQGRCRQRGAQPRRG